MIYDRIQLDDKDENAYLEVFAPDANENFKRKAILIIPGGGYGMVCSNREGEPIAQAFIPYGYCAFVLHYSVAKEGVYFPVHLIQASKAMKHIKDNAQRYNIDAHKVYACGFSAGGHLAGSLGILWDNEEIYKIVDMPKGYNKPAGIMLIYPVVSPEHHDMSFKRLLGDNINSQKHRDMVSLEKHVSSSSSPAFIMHTSNDQVVNVKNSLLLAEAYGNADMIYEMHIYPDAPHGAALGNEITCGNNPKHNDKSIAKWVQQAVEWADKIEGDV